MPSCAQILGADCGSTGESSAVAMRSASAAVYSVVAQPVRCDASSVWRASFHGACLTMNLSTAEISAHTASRPLENSKRSNASLRRL